MTGLRTILLSNCRWRTTQIHDSDGIRRKQGTVIYQVSNAFQTNVILNPEDRQYVSVPILYLEWFRFRFPKHEIVKHTDHKRNW